MSAATAPVATGAASVELMGVGKRYGDAWAVRGLDLDVRAGEFVSLLGPSGCGKTTTLRMIGGFETPDEGALSIGGTEMGALPPHRRPVNTVFQSYALFPHMTVADNVAYGLRLSRVPKSDIADRVAGALDLARMRSFASRKPAQLSGGQQQRVALARALVNRPRVLLLDEPMSALDRKLREEMQLELKLLQHELGITFVFVTHDQGEALTMSDRIAVMRDGSIDQFGSAASVYDEPATGFVAGFIGQQNFLEGRIETLSAAGTAVSTPVGALLAAGSVRGGETRVGDAVRAAVRPEAVTVSPATGDEPGPNRVPGVLRGVSQIGHTLQLVVAIGDAQHRGAALGSGEDRIVATVPRSAAPPTALDTDVVCSFAPDALLLFPADAPPPPDPEPRKDQP